VGADACPLSGQASHRRVAAREPTQLVALPGSELTLRAALPGGWQIVGRRRASPLGGA